MVLGEFHHAQEQGAADEDGPFEKDSGDRSHEGKSPVLKAVKKSLDQRVRGHAENQTVAPDQDGDDA